MDSLELTKNIVRALDTKKAEDIKVLKVENVTILADYFVIATGTNSTQVKAIADEVEFKINELGRKPSRVEGYHNANWIILDYSDVVTHVFYSDTRDYYQLERLWSDGELIDIETLLK